MQIMPIDRSGRCQLTHLSIVGGVAGTIANRGTVEEAKLRTHHPHVMPDVLVTNRGLNRAGFAGGSEP
jgi:hypothetical protein